MDGAHREYIFKRNKFNKTIVTKIGLWEKTINADNLLIMTEHDL